MRYFKLLLAAFCFVVLSLLVSVTCEAQNFHTIAKVTGNVAIKFSHNGKLIACCHMAANDAVGSLDIYDAETGKLAGTIVCNPMFVAFTPKDDIILVKMDQKSFALFDITDLEHPKQLFSTKLDNIISGDISSDGNYYALGTEDGGAIVLSTQSGKVVLASNPFPSPTYTKCCYGNCNFCPIYGMKLLPNNRLLVAGAGMTGKVSILSFSGQVIFTASTATELKGWTADDSAKHLIINSIINNPVYSLTGYPNYIGKIGSRVNTLKYSPSGNNILDFGDEKITVYNSEGKKLGKVSTKGYSFRSGFDKIIDISTDEKKIAFLDGYNLVVGDFGAILSVGK